MRHLNLLLPSTPTLPSFYCSYWVLVCSELCFRLRILMQYILDDFVITQCQLATPLIVVSDVYILINQMNGQLCGIHSGWKEIQSTFLDTCKYLKSCIVHHKKSVSFLRGENWSLKCRNSKPA